MANSVTRMVLSALAAVCVAGVTLSDQASASSSSISRPEQPASLVTGLYFRGSFTARITPAATAVTVSEVQNDGNRVRRVRFRLSACLPNSDCSGSVPVASSDNVDLPPGRSASLPVDMQRVPVPDGTYDGLLLEMDAFYEAGSLFCEGWCAEAANVLRQRVAFPSGGALPNYSDIWWNPTESGWGVSIADHETHLFAVWFTYREDGSPTWFVMSGGTFSENRRRFTGDAYRTTGPPYNAPFGSRPVTLERVGTFTFDFAPAGLAEGVALFTYSVNGMSATKQIQRQSFGNAAAAWGSDLTDLWWDPSESGWGLSINQHGNNVFAVWYTYDLAGLPLFVILPGVTFQGPETFSGELYTTRGPWFGGTFDASRMQVVPFGDATIDFAAGASPAASKIWRPKSGRIKIRKRTNTNQGDVINKVIKQQRFGYDAPGTPPASCNATYGAWSACAADGFQSRLRIAADPPGCPSEPYEFRPCAQELPACTYTYSDWSECQNGSRTRQVLSSTPAGCAGAPGPLTEQCTVAPLCSYTVGDWSGCVNGMRTRSVTASPPGCRPNNPPPGSEACTTPGANARTCTGNFSATAGPPYCGPASFSGRIRLEATDLAMTGSQRLKAVLNPGVHFCDSSVYEWTEDLTITSTREAGGSVVASGRQGDSTYQFDISLRVPSSLNVTGTVSLQQFVPGFPQYNWKWTGTFSCTPQ